MVKKVNVHQKPWNIFAETFHLERVRKVEDLLSKWNMLNLQDILNVGLWKVFIVDTDEAIRLTIASGEGYGSSLYTLHPFRRTRLTESWQSSESLKEEMRKVLEEHFPKGAISSSIP
jgi:hypothetical protein